MKSSCNAFSRPNCFWQVSLRIYVVDNTQLVMVAEVCHVSLAWAQLDLLSVEPQQLWPGELADWSKEQSLGHLLEFVEVMLWKVFNHPNNTEEITSRDPSNTIECTDKNNLIRWIVFCWSIYEIRIYGENSINSRH